MAKISIGVFGSRKNRNKEGEAQAKLAVRAAVAKYLPETGVHVDITMVDSMEIQRINLENRGIDKVTDVLSFPMLDMVRGQCRENLSLAADPDSGLVMLGDIMICYDKVVQQAAEIGHAPEEECAYLALHSALHLLGFDHVDEGEEKACMRAAEKELLKEIKHGN